MAKRRPKPVPQMTVSQFDAMFPDEDACKRYLVARRWPEGPRCPRCGNDKVFPVKSMPFKWQCYKCAPNAGYRFSVIAGTIFENTNKPLRDWFRVTHLMLASKKGMSALQIQRMMGFGSYGTAWSMCHKIRAALIEPEEKLAGIVEIDETFIGGKGKNKHSRLRGRLPDGSNIGGTGTLGSGKTPIVGAITRKGNVIARVIDTISADVLTKFVNEAVSEKVSLIVTDQWTGYRNLHKTFGDKHHVIRHSRGEYVVGSIHTNTIEGFWSIFKRGVVGTFHKVSKKYMGLYVAEFQFRHNNRDNPDAFGAAIAGC